MVEELQKILETPARFVDIVVQQAWENHIVLKDGVARDISSGETSGIGIRVLDKTWGFASSNSLRDARAMVERAYKMAKTGKRIEFGEAPAVRDKVKISPKIDPAEVGLEEKKEILRAGEEATREYKEVVSSTFSYIDSKISYHYMNSEGSDIEAEYTRVGIFTSVFAKKDGKIQAGSERMGATGGLEFLEGVENGARKASQRAVRLLDAGEAPGGNFKVVLDPKLTGVFIHEALGHAMEADHIIQGESILEGKLKDRIGSELVTVYDDPTLQGSFGFYFYDSEGTKARKKAILREGVLMQYLHSRETSSKLGQENTGNARAQGFGYPPIVRMSNTYLSQGDFEFEEMIEDIDRGVYLKGSKGGEVDTARGIFQFSAEEGFIIENGEIGEAIRDVALSGETLHILKEIDAVGKDFNLHIGFCGKGSQLVPVANGGPHIRTFATVGGVG
jgi:TldD protein